MATRQEVADRAGVSVAVVSYVLNNRQVVKEETRRKVLQAIEELGYRPNQMARSLKTKKTRQIAVLIHYIGNPFEAGLLLHIEETAKRHGYFVFVQTYEPEREEELRSLLVGRVDGILLLGQPVSEETLDYFGSLDVPVVSAMQPASGREATAGVPYVDIDWPSAMRSLVAHLRGQGHERIAFMTAGGADSAYANRLEAFREAMAEEEAGAGPSAILGGGGRFEAAERELLRLIDGGGELPFTALVCANDLMAAGSLAACRARGVAVPKRVAIAGCENILMSSQLSPPLTAIHYPRQEAGEAAMAMLLGRMNGSDGEPVRLQGQLIVRGSTRADG
ncbi:LacI family DNA-binding transcriptional regulator [Paenibacillus arenilitoris]|uniref:LacI family DNA-binding transcriptional regulator n=1 Tax=Paenibacillus arenilitoris TaxID=2772299 RepID=A0A927CKQ9_9BACL|nr:LacI family DNA-binding transcriptional regulator [Paenibacillus arenilitoris]MBD2869250.1 LacI family DNA-binding transcriptional regulator [Paenibacillus arenilitoris]